MKVLFCGTEFQSGRLALARAAPELHIEACLRDRVPAAARTADVLVPLMSRIGAEVLFHTSARLVQQFGTGLEGVDIPAASARGIAVCNVPSDVTPNADSTAEHALFLMLGVARRLRECERTFREGGWGTPVGEGLFGSTALILGFGRIGKALASRLIALGMQVDAIRLHPDPGNAQRSGVRRMGTRDDLLGLVSTADFVIATVPGTPATRGMLNAAVFRAMRPTACVVNVSRGTVIEEGDLIEALEQHEIAGAGLDVFAEEPLPQSSPLLTLPTVLATPHIGGVTRQNYEATALIIADNIARVARGELPRYCANIAGRATSEPL